MDLDQFSIASYSVVGETLGQEQFSTNQLVSEYFEYFQKRFRHLSGDLELPLEDGLPGGVDFLDYRVGSDLNGAYVLYYFHDEVVFASLLLSGTDDTSETELMQVFKFLLLDTQDAEEPSEEEIEEVLASDAFDFDQVESRPVVFEVDLADGLDEPKTISHVQLMNRHLASAFFEIDRTK